MTALRRLPRMLPVLGLVGLTACRSWHEKRAWVEAPALNPTYLSGGIATKSALPERPVFYSVSDIKKLASCVCAEWKQWQEEEEYCKRTRVTCTGEGADRICSAICLEWGKRTVTRRECVRWHTCKDD